ncbi:hypothetical protein Zmor_005593 [Zophobas morio]|uniref:Titin n=1 Tax=Zophobas morio TaxID=2755281 RepID=A0AA38IXY4_9CUCU|nr:hypothetical protein Zmor_005593 [Zophobas morio]
MQAAEPAMPTYVGGRRRRKMSTGSLKEGQQRSASEGRRRAPRRTNVSRDSPSGSSAMSLDVRCACQYFQSDSLLPDRINPVGTRPSSQLSNMVTKVGDHEYEPVNPPPDNVSPVATSPPTVHVIDSDREPKPTSLTSSTTSLERRMLGAEVETRPEESFTVQQMQSEIEDKYFAKSAESPSKPKTTVHTITTISTSESQQSQPKKSEGPSKFQQAIKAQTDKFKTKIHEIKKPNIKLPSKPTFKKPNFQKFKIEKPKINLPKIPDTAKITLPTFSLPRKNPLKRPLKQRNLSTESNAGGSKKNYFDFRTYPRLFKKKPKDDLESFSSKSEREAPEFATVPRTKRNKVEDDRWGGRDSIRIPLRAEDSIEDEEREDSVERRIASHMRYDDDIDIDDAYEKENQEIHTASPFSRGYNSRWNHGSFHPTPNQEILDDSRNRQVTDLDSPMDAPAPHESFDTNTSKDIHSSESSLGIHRRGVLEEIDSDEFFLRQKGISQDNIEVGMYLSSEIREAFKSPSNALADLQREPLDYSYDARLSNQSLPETPSKRKAARKPKRKKTPHVSQEQVSFDQDSELDTEIPPSRPKRRSRRNKKQQKELQSIIPYQETIAVDVPDVTIGILQSDDHEHFMYENEQMQGKEQPEITLIDPYAEHEAKYDSEDEVFKEDTKPSAPPRKQRSLKSLTYSEHDSILGDVDPDRELPSEEVEIYKTEHEYIIPTPEVPPTKPARTLSRSSSKSRENEDIHIVQETPPRPTRTRSRSQTQSLTLEEPCVEEICVQDFRDNMGYAIIDKNLKREPPLPPPRTPPRRKRSVQSATSEQKFFTVPRPFSDEPPTRPIRNYSTLGPSRPPRRKPPVNMTDEEKENIDITQYIEIEDEPNRDLHSGEVIQKMRDRPLPAPPRPPRKTRALHDITSEENILTKSQEDLEEIEKEFLEEAEVSTQTEPLPDDFLCDETVPYETEEVTIVTETLAEEETAPVRVERRLITPTSYTYDEETITHGSLVVQPLNGAKILPDSEFSRIESPIERIVPISKDYEDETSEIPQEFTKLKDPEPVQTSPRPPAEQPSRYTESRDQPSLQTTPLQPSVIERIIERPVLVQPDSSTEVEVLKAQRLQVSDLDVDRLSVNELLASRIIVSEIDSGNIQATEISSKSGALKVGEIELPPGIIQQLFERLQSVAQEQQTSGPRDPTPAAETSTKEEEDDAGQKKTPFEQVMVEAPPPQRPPRRTEETHETSVPPTDALIEEPHIIDIESTQIDSLNISETEEIQESHIPEEIQAAEPPEPPVRTDSSRKQTIPEPEPEPVLNVPEDIEEVIEQAPQRPPRHTEKTKTEEPSEEVPELVPVEVEEEAPELVPSEAEEEETPEKPPEDIQIEQQHMEEPEIDDEPPPRPPEPQIEYISSQPPASFYALRAQQYVESLEGDIPMAPRRRRHQKPPISRSSSDESPVSPPSRRRYRSPEPTIPQLTGQLMQACGSAANSSIKRLISYITNNVLRNTDGQQDLHVMIVLLLILIAGLILLGYGDGKTVHYHHWEFFNPPGDL